MSSIIVLFFLYSPESANGQDIQNQNISVAEINSTQGIPWIGISYVNVTKGIANVLGMEESVGVLVTDVAPGGPAEKAGLLKGNEAEFIHGEEVILGGDIIIKADHKTITSAPEFNELTRTKKVGDTLTLTVLRDDQTKDITMRVGSTPRNVFENSSSFSNPDNIDFVPYENFDLEFGIYYPSNWDIEDDRNSVYFRSLQEYRDDRTRDYLRIDVIYKDSSFARAIDEVNVTEAPPNLEFVELPHNGTISGNPGAKSVYTYGDSTHGEIKVIKIAISIEDKLYVFNYFAQASEFMDYLPTIERIIKSFSFQPENHYMNFDMGIRIKYPSTWKILEEDAAAVLLQPNPQFRPDENYYCIEFEFECSLEVFASNPLQDQSPLKQFNDTIQYLETVGTDMPNSRLIESASNHLENMGPVWNITYSYGNPDVGIIIRTHIITIQNDIVYSISYSFAREDYPHYAQIANRMINSIEFFSPVLHADTNLGVLLKYPADFKISHGDNRSITISFERNTDFDYPANNTKLSISVFEAKGNSSYDGTIYNESIGEIKADENYTIYTTNEVGLPTTNEINSNQDIGGNIRTLEVNATFKDKIYNFIYSAESHVYDKFISTITEVINSTRIIDSFSPEESNFKPYDSPYGFTIMYPVSLMDDAWDNGDGSVVFIAKGPNVYSNLTFYIRADPFDGKISDRVSEDIKFIREQKGSILGVNPTDYNGHSGYDFKYIMDGFMFLKKGILNDKNNNLYTIEVSAEPNEFYNFLPIILNMTNSLEFNDIESESRTFTGFKVGDGPLGMAVNPTTNTIYVANTNDNTVSAVSSYSNEIISEIAVSNSPVAVTVNPKTNMIYVTHMGGSMSVIDGKNNVVIANIPLPGVESPLAIAFNPSTDSIYVADSVSKNVSKIDASTNKILNTIPTGTSGYFDIDGIGITVDPLINRIYVANPTTGNVTVIDGSNESILTNIDASGISPYDIAIAPHNNTAYVVGYYGSLGIIDLSRNEVVDERYISSYLYSVGVNPTTNKVYVVDSQFNTIYVIDPKYEYQIVERIAVDSYPTYIALDPNANALYVSSHDLDRVSKINGDTDKIRYGVRFNITDRPIDTEIFGTKFSINASKSVTITCREKNENINTILEETISPVEYVQYDSGAHVECSVQPQNALFPLIQSSWSSPGEFDDNPQDGMVIIRHAILAGSFLDLGNLLRTIIIGPIGSIIALVVVLLGAFTPSLSRISNGLGTRKEKILFQHQKLFSPLVPDAGKEEETTILSKAETIGVDASIIVGVLIFITLFEGFDVAEQTQITLITANIVFPFAISAVLALKNNDKLAIRLMISGFIVLMISVILISLMRSL